MFQKISAQRRKFLFLLLAGALIGAAAFFIVNTGASLDVTNDTWLATGYIEKDIIQHYTGWLMYRTSPLSFPLGLVPAMNSAVSYSDSIPLAAIFFRFFAAVLPKTFQYLGLWTLLCYMLQGASAALLLSLFAKRMPAVLAGTVLFTFSPIMLERSFRHTALASHFLILFALYLYFCNQKQKYRYRAGYLVLLGLATAIHPYFVPMLFAILFADLIQHALAAREWKRPLAFLFGGFATVLAIGYSIGLFSVGSAELGTGYGYFCMNLNSLFNPSSQGGYVWSQAIKVRPLGLGSYDGFNYLGLGVLAALLPCGVLRLWRSRISGMVQLLKRHWGLLFVSVCLTIFAVSSTVLYCNLVIFQINLPAWLETLCSTFRSSGRMFYPVYYLLLLFVFNELARIEPRRMPWLGALLVIAVTAVQLWDISPAIAQKRSFFTEHRQDCRYPLQSIVWEEAAEHCTRLSGPDGSAYAPVQLGYYCAVNGMADDLAFTARFDASLAESRLAASAAALAAGRPDSETLYVTSDRNVFLTYARAAGADVWAVQADELWYLLIPHQPGETLTLDDTAFLYPALGIYVEDYSDDNWTHGISNADAATAVFRSDEASPDWSRVQSLTANGTSYSVLSVDFFADGYVAVQLSGIESADALRGIPCTATLG